jgi:hypothetical protein
MGAARVRGFDLIAIGLLPWSAFIVFWGASHMIIVLFMVVGIAGVGGLSLVLFTERPTDFKPLK